MNNFERLKKQEQKRDKEENKGSYIFRIIINTIISTMKLNKENVFLPQPETTMAAC